MWEAIPLLTDEQEARIIQSLEESRNSCTCGSGDTPSASTVVCPRVRILSRIYHDIKSHAEKYEDEFEDLFRQYVSSGSEDHGAKKDRLGLIERTIQCLQDDHTTVISDKL